MLRDAIREIFCGKKVTQEELGRIVTRVEARTGRPFFKPNECPFSKQVRACGTPARVFRGTRIDN